MVGLQSKEEPERAEVSSSCVMARALRYRYGSQHSNWAILGMQALEAIAVAVKDAFAADPEFARKPLSTLNREATLLQNAGKHSQCIAAYEKLFRKVRERNIVHAELYTCYSNRAAAYLKVSAPHLSKDQFSWEIFGNRLLEAKAFPSKPCSSSCGKRLWRMRRKPEACRKLPSRSASAAFQATSRLSFEREQP